MKRSVIILIILVITVLGFNSVIAKDETFKIGFDDNGVGDRFEDISEAKGMWSYAYGNQDASATVKEKDGNKYMALSGFMHIASSEMIEAPYTFSVDAQISEYGYIGFFVRSTTTVTRYNPHFSADMYFRYYELDWYKEAGGKEDNENGLGGSGIYVQFQSDSIRVNVKTYMPDSLKVGTRYFDFPIPDGLDISKFFNIKFVDSGTKVEIYIENKLLATVEMSEPGEYEDDAEDQNEYLKKAVVKDDKGNVVLSIDNARLSVNEGEVAIGNRNKKLNIDNLSITYSEPDPTATPEQTNTPAPTKTPDKTAIITQVPKTNSPVPDDDTSGFSATLIIAIVSGIVVLAGAVVVVILLKKDSSVK